MPDVRVGIQLSRQPRGEGINFDAGDLRAAVHLVGHDADEMSQPASRFQNAAMLETKLLQRRHTSPG